MLPIVGVSAPACVPRLAPPRAEAARLRPRLAVVRPVLRAGALRAAVFRVAFLRAADLRADFRPALLRAVLRPAALLPRDLPERRAAPLERLSAFLAFFVEACLRCVFLVFFFAAFFLAISRLLFSHAIVK